LDFNGILNGTKKGFDAEDRFDALKKHQFLFSFRIYVFYSSECVRVVGTGFLTDEFDVVIVNKS